MKSKITIVLLITFLITSCSNNQNQPKMISVIDAIGKEKELNLSQIASEVKYIYFDTIGHSVLGEVSVPVFENGYFYLSDIQSGTYKIFDKEGKYVGNLGSNGRGPGEYTRVGSNLISFDSKTDNVYIFSDNKIIEFSVKGSFIKDIPIPTMKDKSFTVMMAKRYINGYVLNIGNVSNLKNDLIFIDETGKIIGEFPDGYNLENNNPDPAVFMKFNSTLMYIVKYNNELNIYKPSNDTIFKYYNGNFRGIYVQDFGKFRTPDNCTDPIQKMKYIQLIGFKTIETENYIFYTYMFGNNLPKDVVPKWVRGLYNKKSGELQLLQRPDNNEFGFKNDIDNKFVFWPTYSNKYGYLLMAIPPKDENGNPGIMIVKLK